MNEILLDETLHFGKCRGCTGRELMERPHGREYLKWVYENTDIAIEATIVVTMIEKGYFPKNIKRQNSRFAHLKTEVVNVASTPSSVKAVTVPSSFRGANQSELYSTPGFLEDPHIVTIAEGQRMLELMRKQLTGQSD